MLNSKCPPSNTNSRNSQNSREATPTFRGPKVVELPRDRSQWSGRTLRAIIESGDTAIFWSEKIQDFIRVVLTRYDQERERAQGAKVAVYTLAEFNILSGEILPAQSLIAIHRLKKIFSANIISVKVTQV